MARILLNYADGAFLAAQKHNAATGLAVGGFDAVAALGRRTLDDHPDFVARNRATLEQPRGAGYWLWKPFLIHWMLSTQLAEGDVLFYCDSGAHFIHRIDPVVELCRQRRDLPILLFTLQAEHRNRVWTKRDCFHYMGLDHPGYANATQILASFIVCERTPATVAFAAEWLQHAEDPRILTDRPNECGLPNYPEFRDHRHDQSILSLLGRRRGVRTVADISQWGNDRRPAAIPQILHHTRWRD
ncbi:hypothetical protein [Azospirillum picis]|uniref:Uncharacterized protein n=1 Tax=Azospirillum picis TaxID=488438 RepID=A0ABU0MLC7_9PROT|nr:hypothetical protein [Azospirillum picis]MBP2300479.1 hypothetical protein [Azospirillum picis]MDQ0534275.1 hypothetical protein [Azospirillum picis]